MNWKIVLPAAAMTVTLMPIGAFARNHHILDGLSPSVGNSATSASTAAPVANTLTSGLTNHSMFNNGSSSLLGNSGLLNNNGIFHKHKHRRNWLSRLLSGNFLGLGRFQNGRFNNSGSVLGNSNSGIFRNLLGHN